MLRFTNNIIGQVTLNCNKRCKYCYEHTHNGDALPNKTSMSFESFKNIFDRCVYERCILGSKENSLMWHFHGGEVFLLPWPELKKMIAYIENRKQFFPNVDWMVQTMVL